MTIKWYAGEKECNIDININDDGSIKLMKDNGITEEQLRANKEVFDEAKLKMQAGDEEDAYKLFTRMRIISGIIIGKSDFRESKNLPDESLVIDPRDLVFCVIRKPELLLWIMEMIKGIVMEILLWRYS
uniref:Uncharacterized protein n=1 Tax=Onchocerca volvulus TaxID=6282 RepID=A0A8R1XND3_ONCVO